MRAHFGVYLPPILMAHFHNVLYFYTAFLWNQEVIRKSKRCWNWTL